MHIHGKNIVHIFLSNTLKMAHLLKGQFMFLCMDGPCGLRSTVSVLWPVALP
uniref:Uncharacterized protein n=1 Tax=Anguilla anguilla TaxID=7936 RepID=A0A0E9VS05_ANGAN